MRSNGAASAFPANFMLLLGLFTLATALFGGASRYDEVQVAILRPLAALSLPLAICRLSAESIRDFRFHLALLIALIIWTAMQLVPLPPAIWHALPNREVLAEIDMLLGLERHWRPISFVPSRTLNALASLIVPVSALLLMLVLPRRDRSLVIMLLIAGMGVLDAMLGVVQVLSGGNSPLYFYDITNRGSPVGIFANENHSATLSVISMPILARLAATSHVGNAMRWVRVAAGPAFLLVLLCVLISGSRAGLALAGPALMASGLMFWMVRRESRPGDPSINRARSPDLNRKFLAWGLGAIIAVSLLISFLVERTPAFEDLLSQNAFEDLRVEVAPVLRQMMSTFWVLGTGFGSFEEVYHIYEPTSLLMPSYVNQAHNDWAQLIIEGGLPAGILLLLLMGWIVSAVRDLMIKRGLLVLGLFWMIVGFVLAAASFVDYPLRTPIFQVLGIWLLVLLAEDRRPAGQQLSTGSGPDRI